MWEENLLILAGSIQDNATPLSISPLPYCIFIQTMIPVPSLKNFDEIEIFNTAPARKME